MDLGQITLGSVIKMLVKTFENNLGKPGNRQIVPLLLSGPGTGKSEGVAQAVKAFAAKVQKEVVLLIGHPLTEESVDYAGHPAIIDGESGPIATRLAYDLLRRMIEAAKEPHKVFIVFFDDVGLSLDQVQGALGQVVCAREVAGHVIPDNIQFVLASNRRGDKAGVRGIISMLSNRCVPVTVVVDPVQVAEHFEEKYGLNDVSGFIKCIPGHLLGEYPAPSNSDLGFCTPRSCEAVVQIIMGGYPDEIERAMIAGAAGAAFAEGFFTFRKVKDSVTKVPSIVADPEGVQVPTRPDALYSQVGMLVAGATSKNLGAISKYVDRIHADFRPLFWRQVTVQRKDLTVLDEYRAAVQKYEVGA